MPNDRRIIELFTRARQAEWAGDIVSARHFIRLLKEEAGIKPVLSDEHPIAVLLERVRQIDARLERVSNEVPVELIVETEILRGIIWRTGERNFELRAYLRDPSMEDDLYSRAHAVSSRYPSLLTTEEGTKNEEKREREVQLPLYENQEEEIPDAGHGSSWAMDGDVYLREVTVGDFGLVRVKMLWTKRDLPESFLIVRKLLEEPLRELGSSTVLNERDTLSFKK